MATFQAWYSSGEHGKLSFDADSLAEAEFLLDQLSHGGLQFTELKNHFVRVKGDELEFSSLDQIED